MRIAVTGGTGFIGRRVASELARDGHQVVPIARGSDRRDLAVTDLPNITWAQGSIADLAILRTAFEGADAVIHAAGINREIGDQTYASVHVLGTKNVVAAAQEVGIAKIIMLSFLRARPSCGSRYHESKWAAEEIVRKSGLNYTILKAGMIFGRGDHMLDHLSHALFTFPFFLAVGFREKPVRPVAVHDIVTIMVAALTDSRLSNVTVPVTGPEELMLSEAARRVGRLVGKRRPVIPAPVLFHKVLARVAEFLMRVPLASRAQVFMLAEGVTQPIRAADELPADLLPTTPFSDEAVQPELPSPGRFGLADLRMCPTCSQAVS